MKKSKAQDNSEETVDEVIYDDEALPSDQVKKLREKLKKCESDKQEYLDGWQRSKADVVNIKKRTETEKAEFAKYATENLIVDLIVTLDSFDMAFKGKAWDAVDDNWKKGVEYIHSNLLNTLKNHGVEEFDPVGEKFDPNKHHAVEGDEGTIKEVVRKGYSLNGKVIRPAEVKVGE